jgi:hypothetical protein
MLRHKWIALCFLSLTLVIGTACCEDNNAGHVIEPDTTAPTTTAIPPGGTYDDEQSVLLTTNEAATIYYTLDHSEPTEASDRYEGPILIPAEEGTFELKFFAKDLAGNRESTKTESYRIDFPPSPIAAPAGSLYVTPVAVTLFCNKPATLYFTTDGNNPTEASAVYSAPIPIAAEGITLLKFFAKDEALVRGPIETEVYVLDLTRPTTTASPAGGTYDSEQFITLTANEFSTIFYTTDGSAPTETSEIYSAPIPITNKTRSTVLRFYAKDTAGNSEMVQSETYRIYPFTAPKNISSTPDNSYLPSMAIDASNIVYLAWGEVSGGWGAKYIDYANSSDWGGSKGRVPTTGDSASLSLAIDSKALAHIAWQQISSNWDVMYANSSDWVATRTGIAVTGNQSTIPVLALDSNDVAHVVWMENSTVFYANSTNWANTTDISNFPAVGCQYPAMAIDSKNVVHVAFYTETGETGNEIYYTNSIDWAGKLNISNTLTVSRIPAIAVDSKDVAHVVWSEDTNGDYSPDEIMYANSTDWAGTQTNISNTAAMSLNPVIAVGPGDVIYVAWEEDIGGSVFDIYLADSTDWSNSMANVSFSADRSRDPALAIDSNGIVYVTWTESVGGSNNEIYLSRSIK